MLMLWSVDTGAAATLRYAIYQTGSDGYLKGVNENEHPFNQQQNGIEYLILFCVDRMGALF